VELQGLLLFITSDFCFVVVTEGTSRLWTDEYRHGELLLPRCIRYSARVYVDYEIDMTGWPF
jgi:hypothetical protein